MHKQVFVYERTVYREIKERLKTHGISNLSSVELSNFFSPWYAQHMGKIKVASGNKTVESWCHTKLRVHYYIFSYPSLLKIHSNPQLLSVLNGLLQNEALLQLDMRSLAPAFKDPEKQQWFEEVLDNYLKLWEVNL
ncbi:torso-like protein [Photinus pyralis]|uniref:torso-like protein n=1 Tax=Photinus pyralis TaxID=7054 RepID=UPI001267590A|nr:torso-like protein [Photinus pyralis]